MNVVTESCGEASQEGGVILKTIQRISSEETNI